MTRVRLLPEATHEYELQAAYYRRVAGSAVSRRFVDAVAQALDRVAEHPRQGTPIFGEVRRMRVRRFPFSICYQPQADGVVVVAIAHNSRRPDYWLARLGEEP